MFVHRTSLAPLAFEGLQIFDYTSALESSSSLAVIEVPPGVRHAPAWSKRSDKYYLVIRGLIRFALDKEERALGEGDFCLVRQGTRFSYRNDGREAAALVLVHTPSFQLESEVFVGEGRVS